MTLITPARRAHLVSIGRLGGLTTAAKIDTKARASAGQTGFRKSFANGHGCTTCPLVEIPADVSDEERERRAELLYRLHFVRLGQKSRR